MTYLALLEDVLHLADAHAKRLISDVELAATRMEHIRLSARANEAQSLVQSLKTLVIEETKEMLDEDVTHREYQP